MTALGPGQAEAIVEAGILAPSADNRHLVRFHVGEGEIVIHGTEGFDDLPFHRRVLALISLGAVVENMVLRAGRLGLRAIVQWPTSLGSPHLAELQRAVLEPHEGPVGALLRVVVEVGGHASRAPLEPAQQ